MEHNKTGAYRPEVDGLRALAVVPVLLYHAGLAGFNGGYVGVDVFFVISGYLITTIIQQELNGGRFTLVGFYERRARRILPALYVVMLACIPLAWLWMTPHHLKGFAQSLVATTVFAPNIYFLLKTGYFETDADELPLLHTWSLGVEEQYYIAFPLFMMLCWRFGQRRLVLLIAAIALVSLGLSEWASHTHPQGNFFLPFTRAWELGLGALVALLFANDKSASAEWPRLGTALALLGLAALLLPVFFYERSTRFPGLYALAPTLGTALVLVYARGNNLVARLLSIKAVVGVGLISYSVYLWHQPLFAFARLHSVQRPSPLELAALSLLALLLGYLSWRFVEKPMRDKNRFSRRQIFTFAGAASLLLMMLGLAGHATEGFPGRLTPEQLRMLAVENDRGARYEGFPAHPCFLAPNVGAEQFGNCTEKAIDAMGSMFIWGDSHAASLVPGIRERLGSRWNLTTLTAAACRPISRTGTPACQTIYAHVIGRIRQERPERVLLAGVWGHADWQRLGETLHDLRQAGVQQIDVVGPLPRWNPTLPIMLLRYGVAFDALPWRSKLSLDPTVPEVDTQLGRLVRANGANYISAWAVLCNAEGCQVRTGSEPESMMQWDVSHFTAAGSKHLVRGFSGPGW